MIELAFNELSFNIKAANEAHAIALLNNLFDICNSISKLDLAPLRLRTIKDFKRYSLIDGHFTLEEYLERLPVDDRGRYLGYLAQDPLLSINPYYYFGNEEVTGFGYAYKTNTVAVSINNNGNWQETAYEIRKDYLPEGPDAEIVSELKLVPHLPNTVLLNDFLPNIKQPMVANATFDIATINDINHFWQRKENLFAMLDFSIETEELLLKFESKNHPDFIKATQYFEKLNQHLLKVSLKEAGFGQIPGNKSNDGEATLDQYGAERTFTIPSGQLKIFSLHVTLGNLRIYLYPNEAQGRYVVGHVGHHLRTKKFN
ncbi:hypothetical protein D3C86_1397120 [compost metagenome]